MQIPKASSSVERSLRISLLVGKAYLNKSFRKRLSTDFDSAADQFNLTAQEKSALRDVDWSGIVEFVDALGPRPVRLGAFKVQAVTFGNLSSVKGLKGVVGLGASP